MLRNSLQQMLVEGAPFEACHGKACLGIAALLPRFQLAQGKSTHTGIEVNMQLAPDQVRGWLDRHSET